MKKKLYYEIMCCKEYQPMRAKELAVLLQIPAGKREELHKILVCFWKKENQH